MSNTRIIVRPRSSAAVVEGIPQDVLFVDNHIETIVLAPGQIPSDLLRDRGVEDRDFIVVPRSRLL